MAKLKLATEQVGKMRHVTDDLPMDKMRHVRDDLPMGKRRHVSEDLPVGISVMTCPWGKGGMSVTTWPQRGQNEVCTLWSLVIKKIIMFHSTSKNCTEIFNGM